ncbi:MAG: hypothetical protein KJ630_19295 [Proteobacteria bacterium]|nr:hypothetical protein [Pseudomonadota bacterium]
MKLEDIEREHKKLTKRLDKLNAKKEKVTSRVAVICESNHAHGKGCGAGFYIDELEFIQTYWYESPYGCTGGDNWLPGEGQFECPKCGHRNRFLERQDIEAMKYSFKSIVDEHKD